MQLPKETTIDERDAGVKDAHVTKVIDHFSDFLDEPKKIKAVNTPKKRKRKTRHQKRAERIQRVAPSLSLEEIMPLSEDAARALHQQNVRDWFGGQNTPALYAHAAISTYLLEDLEVANFTSRDFSNAESRWL